MPVTRWNYYKYGDGLEREEDGEYMLYEDHLEEVANLNHIIAALEGQVKLQAEQIGKMQKFKEVKWHMTEE